MKIRTILINLLDEIGTKLTKLCEFCYKKI